MKCNRPSLIKNKKKNNLNVELTKSIINIYIFLCVLYRDTYEEFINSIHTFQNISFKHIKIVFLIKFRANIKKL